jgi:hypothetical protein
MAQISKFQIRSKKDAQYFVKELKNTSSAFSYEMPLMGACGGIITVSFPTQWNEGRVISSSCGYHNEKSFSLPSIVKFIWDDRKHINKELRYIGPLFSGGLKKVS